MNIAAKILVLLVVAFWPSEATIAGAGSREPTPSEVRALLESNGSANLGAQLGPIAAQQVIAGLRRGNPFLSPRAEAFAHEFVATFVAKRAEQDHLVDKLVPIYSKHLTADDVRQLTNFYRSPIGKKLLEVTPLLFAESTVVGEQWATSILPELQAQLMNRLRAEKLIN